MALFSVPVLRVTYVRNLARSSISQKELFSALSLSLSLSLSLQKTFAFNYCFLRNFTGEYDVHVDNVLAQAKSLCQHLNNSCLTYNILNCIYSEFFFSNNFQFCQFASKNRI